MSDQDEEKEDPNSVKGLISAINRKDTAQIQEILDAGKVNIERKFGQSYRSALNWACYAGSLETCHKLLKKKANKESADTDGNTPLLTALVREHHDCAFALLKLDVNVNAVNIQKRSALHFAAASGNQDLVLDLLKRNANANIQDIKGNTPLILALQGGHDKIAMDFILHGVNLNLLNWDKMCALSIATEMNDHYLVMYLIVKGSNVFLQDAQGFRPFILAENNINVKLEDRTAVWKNDRIKYMLQTAEEAHNLTKDNQLTQSWSQEDRAKMLM